MNVKLKGLVSLALTMLVMGGLAPLTHAGGPLNNYQLTNIVIYMKDPKKLKQFSLINKKTRRVAQTPKINPCPVSDVEVRDFYDAKPPHEEEVYDRIFDICENIETVRPKSFCGLYYDVSDIRSPYSAYHRNKKNLEDFNFDKVYVKDKISSIRTIHFEKGTFHFCNILDFLSTKQNEISKNYVLRIEKKKNDTSPCFKLIVEYKGKRIQFDVSPAYLFSGIIRSPYLNLKGSYTSAIREYNKLCEMLKKDCRVSESDKAKLELLDVDESCKNVQHLTTEIDEYMLRIKDDDFSKNLKSIAIKDVKGKLTSLKCRGMFKSLPNVKSFMIPSSVKKICKGVFEESKFEEIAISKGTTPIKILKGAFYGAGKELKFIYIPQNAIIDPGIFSESNDRENNIDYGKYNDDLKIIYGIKEYSLPEFKAEVLDKKNPLPIELEDFYDDNSDNGIEGCEFNFSRDYWEVKANSIGVITTDMFKYHPKLKKFTASSTLNTLQPNAFNGSSFEKITIYCSDDLKIKKGAFNGCSKDLKSIDFFIDDVKKLVIDPEAFNDPTGYNPDLKIVIKQKTTYTLDEFKKEFCKSLD